jgi:hypothetical protein
LKLHHKLIHFQKPKAETIIKLQSIRALDSAI